ncbi:cyanophycinase [Nakamurella multipartita DSM 44233]|uniref:Cyanophycinase n=1 Tax=Nakamurella multipartita (strain ATCC 700099 / DSM 44233 / CIP 104796 / JCM 9543 / NBRC 105858 / Y-104) TaxID=479431 RepID=C8X935_NAKMY|nr:cyanophycinase [Nakamurella multipartita DSM 44233]
MTRVTAASAAAPAAGPVRGIVMPIGGAEDKVGRMTVLREVVRLAGGSAARIVVISTASSLGDEITHAYLQIFSSLGVSEVVGIRPESRAQAAAPDLVEAVDGCSAVFMTGGNQVKLAAIVVGTPLGAAITAAHHRGALIAGTSAGASILSTHMISLGSGGATPKFRMSQVSEGLGLLPQAIVDQHFTQRNRFGRLLSLVANNPAQLGIGVDEDTAAIIRPDGRLEVKGRGVVTVMDGSAALTTAYTATGTQPLMISDVRLHSLPRGVVFDLDGRCLVSAPGLPDLSAPPTVARPVDVPAGLRPDSRRIAAEGAHESTAELRRRPASS